MDQCLVVNDLVRNTKEIYFSSVGEDNHGNQRVLFFFKLSTVFFTRKLNPTILMPVLKPTADQFNSFFFFQKKIRLIREELPQPFAIATDLAIPCILCQCGLRSFSTLSLAVLKSCKVKSYALNPVPAPVLTGCLPVLLPVITDLVNCSLDTALMLVALEIAMTVPLLKTSKLLY